MFLVAPATQELHYRLVSGRALEKSIESRAVDLSLRPAFKKGRSALLSYSAVL